MNRELLASKAALTILLMLLGVLSACGGGSNGSNTNGGGSNNGGSSLPPGTELLYAGDIVGNVHAFSVDSNTGALTSLSSTLVTNSAAAGDVQLAADPSGAALYATSAGTGGPNVVAFTIDSSTGALTAVAANQTLPVAAGQIVVDPKGKNAYVIPKPSENTAQLWGFSIDPTTHGLSALPNQPIQLPGIPNDLTVDPSGAFVYVTFDGTPGDEIAGFSRDLNTGALSVLSGSPFANTGGDSPQGIRVTPDGKFVIVGNQATNNVSVLSLASGTGVLTNVAGSPFASGNAPTPVAIDSTGNFAFVGNVVDSSLSVYAISAAGALSPVAGTPVMLPVNAGSTSIAGDPSNKFVYIGTVPKASGVLGFTLDAASGSLTPISGSPFTAGETLRGIVVVTP
jgi:6-phosphogluconolactonase